MTNMFFDLSRNLPEENYFTNSFAFLLRNNEDLVVFLLERLLKRGASCQEMIRIPRKERVVIATQVQFPTERSVVDMSILIGDKLAFFVENKVWGTVFPSQVKKYLKVRENYLSQHVDSQIFIIFLTMLKNAPKWFNNMEENENLFHCSWSEINDYLRDFISKRSGTNKKYYLSSFLEFMESKGMKSFSGFKLKDYSSHWREYSKFREDAKLILKELKGAMLKMGFISYPKEDPNEGEDFIRYYFHKKNWKWRLYYHVQFELAPDTDGGKDYIWLCVSLFFQKTFREFYGRTTLKSPLRLLRS